MCRWCVLENYLEINEDYKICIDAALFHSPTRMPVMLYTVVVVVCCVGWEEEVVQYTRRRGVLVTGCIFGIVMVLCCSGAKRLAEE
jgi:hypothetical protein